MSLPNPQTTTFLFKLPLETREEIYKHILLGWGRSPIVHIREKYLRLHHYRCIEKEDVPCNGLHLGASRNATCGMLWKEFQVREKAATGDGMNWYFRRGMDDNLLPTLVSCKRMYNEMISLLYSETTFHFRDCANVSTFAHSILPAHLNTIHSLFIEWDITDVYLPSSNAKWQKIWDTVAGMERIGEVRLIVVASIQPHWHEEFQWKWKHEGIAKRIEARELKVDFWSFGKRIEAIFGKDERRDLPSTYSPVQWGPEWYECQM